ncbi:MAG TPA: heme o synthase [Polyangiaceae bacterium]|nr:heme o synthase [Polyangiaceae bacterium]
MAMTGTAGLTLSPPHASWLSRGARTGALLVALTKPRVTALVVFTFAFGAAMAPGRASLWTLALSALGTLLVVAAANTLNMWWERDTDAKMTRTQGRPLATGALSPRVALAWGLGLFAASMPLLGAANARVAAVGALAFAIYVFAYTPLKRRTWHSLSLGALAGAAPPLMGWAAVTGSLDAGALALFAVLFVWQLPHSTAISLFRAEEYAAAGLRVCSVELGARAAVRATVGTSIALVALTAAPYALGLGGAKYALAAAVLGAGLLGVEARRAATDAVWGRRVFAASIAYQVLLFGALWLDRP